MIKAIIFDFDDTLCMTELDCFVIENTVLRKMGRPEMTREIHKSTWGMVMAEAMELRSPGVDIDSFLNIHEEVYEKLVKSRKIDVISNSTLSALSELKKRGYQLCVLTSRTLREFKHVINSTEHPLKKYISSFYYRDNMTYHKPDPRAFAHIEVEHGWKPEECVYVGDSVSDAQAATGAGLKCVITLKSGLRKKEDFSGYKVDKFIADISELKKAVERI